jgi:general transcription factor 3C polypeptide 2
MVAAGSPSRDLIAAIFPDMTSNPKNIMKLAVRRFPIYETSVVPYQDSPGSQKPSSNSSGSPNLPKLKHALKSSNITPYPFQDAELSAFHNMLFRESVLYTLGRGTFSTFLDKLQLSSVPKVNVIQLMNI